MTNDEVQLSLFDNLGAADAEEHGRIDGDRRDPSSLHHAPAFRRLSPNARFVFLDLVIGFGESFTAVDAQPDALALDVSAATGLELAEVITAFAELHAEGWVRREKLVRRNTCAPAGTVMIDPPMPTLHTTMLLRERLRRP